MVKIRKYRLHSGVCHPELVETAPGRLSCRDGKSLPFAKIWSFEFLSDFEFRNSDSPYASLESREPRYRRTAG